MLEPFDHTTGLAIRILEVEDLGWDATLIEIEGETILLMDVLLSQDDRIEIMTQVMASGSVSGSE